MSIPDQVIASACQHAYRRQGLEMASQSATSVERFQRVLASGCVMENDMAERICWLILALAVHLPPFAAFFAPSLIARLYSVNADDPNFALLHHRAALFGVIVVACLWAAFDPNVRKLAVVLTSLSMISFLAIYLTYGQPAALRTIAIVDIIGLPLLAYVGWKAFAA